MLNLPDTYSLQSEAERQFDSFPFSQNPEDVDWEEQWTPQVFVENVLGEPKESLWYTLSFGEMGECTVYEKRRISGFFLEFLELNEFPFDTQVGKLNT